MINWLKISCFFLIIQMIGQQTFGQAKQASSDNGIYIGFSYAYQIPLGELSDRFGGMNSMAVDADFVHKGKWQYTLQQQFFFGRNVKQNLFSSMITDEGYVINTNSDLATLVVRARGWQTSLQVARIFDLDPRATVSGIRVGLGLGYLSHKIKIVENAKRLPLFEEPYVRGYDHLTRGFNIQEFIGYQHFDARGKLNFFAGIECIQGFTKNQRKWDYNLQQQIDGSRVDILLGFRVGLQITITSIKKAEDIYY